MGPAKSHETVTASLEKDKDANNGDNMGRTEAGNDNNDNNDNDGNDKNLPATPSATARPGASNETPNDNE